MTIERTRQLLGDKVKGMTDQQIQELIQRFSLLADVAIQAIKDYSKYSTAQKI